MQVKKESIVMSTTRRVGRPARFDLDGIKLAKEVVAQFGLRKGVEELAKRGVKVSLPTLSKYIHSRKGGKAIKLRRGRPSLAA